MELIQGNTYELTMTISTIQGKSQVPVEITPDNAQVVQVILGSIDKIWKKENNPMPEEIKYSEGKWRIYLTQKDTFALKGEIRRQVRIKCPDGQVIASDISRDCVYDCITRRII